MKRQRGQVFILVLILLTVGGVLIVPFLQSSTTSLKSRAVYGQYIKEDYAADAAIEYGLWRITWEPDFAENLPVGEESEPFSVTVNGIVATTTVVAQVPPTELSGQELAGDAAGEEYFRVSKSVVVTTVASSLAYDGLESGYPSSGTGSWSGPWSLSGEASRTTEGEYEGSYCLRLGGDDNESPGDGYARRVVDLSGVTGFGPYLTFWARCTDLESSQNDKIEVKVSINGTDWDIIETFDDDDDSLPYTLYQYNLSSYGTPESFYLAFDSDCNHSSDLFYVDEIEFSESEEATEIVPGENYTYTYYVSIECMDPDGCVDTNNLDRIIDELPERGAPSGDYLQYIYGSTDWDAGEWGIEPFNPTDIDTDGWDDELHQELEWDFENAGESDVDFEYGENKTMSFQARAALTEGVYCNKIWVSVSSWDDEGDIISGTTAKIIVGDPAETSCPGGLLSITKVADPIIIYPNEETIVTYTITIENVDTEPIPIYQIEDWLPSTGSADPDESFVYVDNSTTAYITDRESLPVLFFDNFNGADSNTVPNWTDSDGSGSNVALSSDSVRLRIPTAIYYGNQFLVTGTSGIGNMTSTSSNVRTSLRFTAQSNQTVTKIRVYLETEAGTSPTYRYGLRANSSGNPSSNWLGATQHGYGDLTATTTGWQTITLGESVSLTAGTVYHIVVQHQSGTVNGSNYIALRRGTPQNMMLPYDGASDSQSNTLWYNGSWSTQNYQPIYLLETAAPTYEGNPYHTYNDTGQQIYGNNYYGERLTISGGNQSVDQIGFYVRCNSSTDPADHLYYQIRDSADTVIRSGTLVAKTAIGISYAWYDAALSSSLTLVNGATYRVDLYSTSSTASYYYQVLRNDNTNDAAYNGRNYYGTGSIYCSSSNGGSSWTPSDQYDIPFRLRNTAGVYIEQSDIDTTGYIGIELSYDYQRGTTSGTNPTLKVEWKLSSSGTWTTLGTHNPSDSNWHSQTWNLPAEADGTSIDIRFTDITVSAREMFVDDVLVTCVDPMEITPVCMPDESDDDFFDETWHADSMRWELDWNFYDYPGESDTIWNIGGLCEGYPFNDYDPYLELQPGEALVITFQATVTLTASGSYYNEVFVRIDYDWDEDWLYSWPTGGVSVPQYDLQAQTLSSILRANAMLDGQGMWRRSWHWWRHR